MNPEVILSNTFLLRAPTDPSKTGKTPPVTADSEVYKMLQENQESDEPPRQSASFKVLQEILETGTDTDSSGYWALEIMLYSNLFSMA